MHHSVVYTSLFWFDYEKKQFCWFR